MSLTTDGFSDHCAFTAHILQAVLQTPVFVRAVAEAGGAGGGSGFVHTVDASTAEVLTDLIDQRLCGVGRERHHVTAPVSRQPEGPAAFTVVNVRVTWGRHKQKHVENKYTELMFVPCVLEFIQGNLLP